MKPKKFVRATSCVLVGAMLFAFSLPAISEEEKTPPQIEQLDDERYRIGKIIVDKEAQSFTVPGKILVLKEPLEYLAVSIDGMKGVIQNLPGTATRTEDHGHPGPLGAFFL